MLLACFILIYVTVERWSSSLLFLLLQLVNLFILEYMEKKKQNTTLHVFKYSKWKNGHLLSSFNA